MTIIFLCVTGVLNSEMHQRHMELAMKTNDMYIEEVGEEADDEYLVDPTSLCPLAISNLLVLLETVVDVRLVLYLNSASDPIPSGLRPAYVLKTLSDNGLPSALVIDVIEQQHPIQHEVSLWRTADDAPDFDDYAIFTPEQVDERDKHAFSEELAHTVVVNPTYGLTMLNVQAALTLIAEGSGLSGLMRWDDD